MKAGTYIMAPGPISTAYFLNSSRQSVGLSVYTPIVARQRFGKHVPAVSKNYRRRHFLCRRCRIKGK
jgi:hypothetical protein